MTASFGPSVTFTDGRQPGSIVCHGPLRNTLPVARGALRSRTLSAARAGPGCGHARRVRWERRARVRRRLGNRWTGAPPKGRRRGLRSVSPGKAADRRLSSSTLQPTPTPAQAARRIGVAAPSVGSRRCAGGSSSPSRATSTAWRCRGTTRSPGVRSNSSRVTSGLA